MTLKDLFSDWPYLSLSLLVLTLIIIAEICLIFYNWFCANRGNQPPKETHSNELWIKIPENPEMLDHSIEEEDIVEFTEEELHEEAIEVITESTEVKTNDKEKQEELEPIPEVVNNNEETTEVVIESPEGNHSELQEVEPQDEQTIHPEEVQTELVVDIPQENVSEEQELETTPKSIINCEPKAENHILADVVIESNPDQSELAEKLIFEITFNMIEENYSDYRGLRESYLKAYNSSTNAKTNWNRLFSDYNLNGMCYTAAIEWTGDMLATINSRQKLDIYLMVDQLIELKVQQMEDSYQKNNKFFERFNIIKSWQHFRR